MRPFLIVLFVAAILTSCTTDFPKKEISTPSLSGFIEGGNAAGVYGKAGLKITADSIKMNDWSISRLVNSLNTLRDTSIVDQTGFSDVYTIQIANIGELEEGAFCDSLIVELGRAGLAK
ncbi:hypothetical protein LX97_01300 [Nonlabens dokdonensis]|jgi:hypothetical protein|uniref:Lipoprotein n=2 Tax=Nonlabens dokdonensis TaxID=328515 RepID=L7W4T3_NONDD|nr:hypothetical protein [Nonlabens dokdonensis]AGC76640.1 hypothetical protein DDD_1513 [Nonlabens dokdonensis DSW-6]PZX44289.1 hypothetical protein LX97_01300 [Nonlabens dokdonensis]